MSKKTTKQLSSKNTLILGLVTVVIAAAAFGFWQLNSKIDLNAYDDAMYMTDLDYRINQLNFCLKNSITQCDEGTLEQWNKDHNNNQFDIKSYSERVKQSTAHVDGAE